MSRGLEELEAREEVTGVRYLHQLTVRPKVSFIVYFVKLCPIIMLLNFLIMLVSEVRWYILVPV